MSRLPHAIRLPALTQLARNSLDYVLPNRCALCSIELVPDTNSGLCSHCWQAMPTQNNRCIGCAHAPSSEVHNLCATCQQPNSATRIAQVCVAGFQHDEAAAELVARFKFAGELACARPLVSALLQQIVCVYDRHPPLPQIILPVPLSNAGHLKRGFNQSHVLARRIGRALDLPVKAHWLTRKHRPPQRELSRSNRIKLPTDTFRVTGKPTAQHVVVIDDVLTTGSTVRAIAAVLKQAGVKRVDVWCATRSMLE